MCLNRKLVLMQSLAQLTVDSLKLCGDIIRGHEGYWRLYVDGMKSCKEFFIRRLVVIDVVAWRLQ